MDAWGVSAAQCVWLPGRMMGSDPPPIHSPRAGVQRNIWTAPYERRRDEGEKKRLLFYVALCLLCYTALSQSHRPLSLWFILVGVPWLVFAFAGAPLCSPPSAGATLGTLYSSSPSARPPLQEHLSAPSSPFVELHMGELLPDDAVTLYLELMGQLAVMNASETKNSSVHG